MRFLCIKVQRGVDQVLIFYTKAAVYYIYAAAGMTKLWFSDTSISLHSVGITISKVPIIPPDREKTRVTSPINWRKARSDEAGITMISLMLRCIAIDDDPLALELIKEYASQVEFITLLKTFISPAQARTYLDKFPIDLIFLDTRMRESNGIEFLKSLEHRPLVIFATAFHEYAVEGFAVDAVDYLLKPFGFERFLKGVTKANGIFRMNLESIRTPPPSIFIRSGHKLIKILLDDIEYIEGLNYYIKIVIAKEKVVLSKLSLKEILLQLPASRFIRVHRSFIVPVERIVGYNRSRLLLGNTVIPVGVTYLNDVKKVFR